ncbi:MAG TPA: carbonic anhydrase [Anaeromyxobacteraceae bacterium]|nr:carbonic anhydrase [Anaeromyxobacteraceae bacterium]
MTRALLLAFLLVASPAAANDAAPTAEQARAAQQAALQALSAGNARFVEGKQAPHDLGDARRHALAKGQHPHAAILSCSDSRVPPEHVLDQQLGEIFVVRTAGNVADGVALGSLEYAVEHLGVPVVVVLGHQSCGAVTAAVAAHGKPLHDHGHIDDVLKLVDPAVARARQAGAKDLVDASIRANVDIEAERLVRRSPVIAERVRSGRLKVVKALYDLETGKVSFADTAGP